MCLPMLDTAFVGQEVVSQTEVLYLCQPSCRLFCSTPECVEELLIEN